MAFPHKGIQKQRCSIYFFMLLYQPWQLFYGAKQILDFFKAAVRTEASFVLLLQRVMAKAPAIGIAT